MSKLRFKKEILVTTILWFSSLEFISFVRAEDVCESVESTCPSDSCCRPSICAAENSASGGSVKCCDQATLDKGEDFNCAVACAECIDCKWGPWDTEDYDYPNGTKTITECQIENKCGDGLSPKRVTGKKTRRHEKEPGPGRNCEGSSLESCSWDCPENCQWNEYGDWVWDKTIETDGNKEYCGNGKRTRDVKTPAKYGGKNCEPPSEMTDYRNCPGRWLSFVGIHRLPW